MEDLFGRATNSISPPGTGVAVIGWRTEYTLSQPQDGVLQGLLIRVLTDGYTGPVDVAVSLQVVQSFYDRLVCAPTVRAQTTNAVAHCRGAELLCSLHQGPQHIEVAATATAGPDAKGLQPCEMFGKPGGHLRLATARWILLVVAQFLRVQLPKVPVRSLRPILAWPGDGAIGQAAWTPGEDFLVVGAAFAYDSVDVALVSSLVDECEDDGGVNRKVIPVGSVVSFPQ